MSLHERARVLLAQHGRIAVVTLAGVEGSSPREEGAQMLVAPSGFAGSIGGGTLEWQALAEAQRLLQTGKPTSSRIYALGPDLGQCCGGRVRVETRLVLTAAELADVLAPERPPRPVVVFGAGHVGKSLVLILAQGPFAVTWVDPRPKAFPAILPGNVTALETRDPLASLSGVADGSCVIVMSHSHELDFAVTDASLRNDAVARVLLIGSKTKRARFISRLKAAGHGQENLARLICPIGDGAIAAKTPFAVALSTAHQLMVLDEALRLAQTDKQSARQRRRA